MTYRRAGVLRSVQLPRLFAGDERPFLLRGCSGVLPTLGNDCWLTRHQIAPTGTVNHLSTR